MDLEEEAEEKPGSNSNSSCLGSLLVGGERVTCWEKTLTLGAWGVGGMVAA